MDEHTLDKIRNRVAEFEKQLLTLFHDEYPEIVQELDDKGEMSSELHDKVKTLIVDFKSRFVGGAAK